MSENVLLDIVQQVKKLEEWSAFPKRQTMPIALACDTCARNLAVRQSLYSQGYIGKAEYRSLEKDERAQLKETAEKYFDIAKALLRSFRGVKGLEPRATFRVLSACPHTESEDSKLSVRFGEELRQSIKPLADLMVKVILDEERSFKQVIRSPLLRAYYVDGRYEGLRLICDDCIHGESLPQLVKTQSVAEAEANPEFPCGDLDTFSTPDCISHQLRVWLKSNEFELQDNVIGFQPHRMIYMVPTATLATKNAKNYLLMTSNRGFYSVDAATRLKKSEIKLYGLVARDVTSILLELPLEDDWVAYDLEIDQLIKSPSLVKLSDTSIDELIDLLISQDIASLDHDSTKRFYTKLSVEKSYLTSEEIQMEGGAVDVAWYDKERKCVIAIEIESSAGTSVAKDIYKMKSLAPSLMIIVIKKGKNTESVRNYSKETGGIPLLAIFPEYSWILFNQANIIKMGKLQQKGIAF